LFRLRPVVSSRTSSSPERFFQNGIFTVLPPPERSMPSSDVAIPDDNSLDFSTVF
jgi:hypothetical protein